MFYSNNYGENTVTFHYVWHHMSRFAPPHMIRVKIFHITLSLLNIVLERRGHGTWNYTRAKRNICKRIVLILDGNLEVGAHVMGILCYLICSRHLIRSRAVTNRFFFSEKAYFPSRSTFFELPSNICTMARERFFFLP